jgi:pyruvate/2-oxoglutarate dehydrogenase complex dihydrolipoamide dehydrogenase (E3) component
VVRVSLSDGSTVEAEEILVAIGRVQNTDVVDGLGFEAGKPLPTDSRCRVRGFEDWLFAIGDLNGKALLTHMGKYQGRVAADVILGKDARVTQDGQRSPRVIFTDPQVCAVGHTLASAREEGLSVRAVDVSTQGNAGASFYGREARGTTRLVIDEDRGVIAGATFTGPEVADFLHAATIAVVGEVPLERLAHAVPSFPTRSEVWLYLLEELGL